MAIQSGKTLIYTVGLEACNRELLDTRFAPFPQFQFSHHLAWSPDVLDSDVVLVDLDSPVSHDALEMMREFRGTRDPVLVLFSATDEHLSGEAPADAADPVPGLCRRLREVLPNLDCSQASAPTTSGAAIKGSKPIKPVAQRQGGAVS